MNTFALARRAFGALLALVAGVAAVLALSSWTSSAVAAAPYPPTAGCGLTVTSGSGGVTVIGSGYAPDSSVGLTLDGSTSLGSAKTNADGAFQTTVTLPAAASDGRAHTISATSGSTTCSAPTGSGTEGTSATRGSGGSAGGSGGSGSGGLASTGAKVATISLVGVALLAGGAFLMVAARRRRT